ncbi:MAG: DUF2652 domain-containing protein [Flavobacteriales bacterium]|nr:DUF2652 domain-containing protein [Flavobacteriales bacterium]
MSERALYYIPDISGFTNFVTNVEVEHSQHIISELLELIIDSNLLNFSVAEVEGDAIFFYKNGDIPSADEILKQTQETYVQFHDHLKAYETKRICDCGACKTAATLSIKFVAHEGAANMITVKGKKKPFGEDVITVHRLLKNSVTSDEYLLYTGDLLDKAELIHNDEDWSKLELGEEDFEGVNGVAYKSIGLSFLKKLLKPSLAKKYKELTTKPLVSSIDINGSRSSVYELLSNMELRYRWNKAAKEIKYTKGEVTRVGSKHLCVFEKSEIEFETVTNDFGRNKLVYGEASDQFPLIKEGTTYYILEGDDKQTNIRTEFHYEAKPFFGWLLKILGPFLIKKRSDKALKAIKEIIETEKA